MKRNKIFKTVLPIATILVLFGLAACLFIEPALALSHQESDCAAEGEHCCFICNASQHQWNISDLTVEIFRTPTENLASVITSQFYSHSSLDPIFHPPPVSLRI